MFGEIGKAEIFRMPKKKLEGFHSVQTRQSNDNAEVINEFKVKKIKLLRANPELSQF